MKFTLYWLALGFVTIGSGFPTSGNSLDSESAENVDNSIAAELESSGQSFVIVKEEVIDFSGDLLDPNGFTDGSGIFDDFTDLSGDDDSLASSGLEVIDVFQKDGDEYVVARRKRDAGSTANSATNGTTPMAIAATATTTSEHKTESSGAQKCVAMKTCYASSDCGSGSCLGLFVGTCNCNACLSGFLCDSDAACGGLHGSCVNSTDKSFASCNCIQGYKSNGYPLFSDAITQLCDVKMCTKESAATACYGLPCNSGVCVC